MVSWLSSLLIEICFETKEMLLANDSIISASLSILASKNNNKKAQVLAEALDAANNRYLLENKSPSRKVGELDNRGSHFYLAMFWSQALATQTEDQELKEVFAPIAESLSGNENKILTELTAIQGHNVEIGGYYYPDTEKLYEVMRPSKVFNQIIDQL